MMRSQSCSCLFLGKTAFFNEALVAHGDFYRIQIFSLDVFHDGHFQHALVIRVAYICRYFLQACQTASPEPPFPAYDLIPV